MSETSMSFASGDPFLRAQAAAEALNERLGNPDVAVVLGSGWAASAENLGVLESEVSMDSIPGLPAPSVDGHGSSVRAVSLGGKLAWLFSGRTHLYEGATSHEVVHGVRSAVLAGSQTVILTNAAGSLDPEHGPGTPVIIRDQLNLTGTTPMLGAAPPADFPGRFADVSEIYSRRLRAAAHAHDSSLGEGVYAGLLGGAYETPAEIKMLAGFGATLVGMSTVLEALAAAHLGAEVAGVSLVTNLAAGMAGKLNHEEVLEVAADSTDRIMRLIEALIKAA